MQTVPNITVVETEKTELGNAKDYAKGESSAVDVVQEAQADKLVAREIESVTTSDAEPDSLDVSSSDPDKEKEGEILERDKSNPKLLKN